MSRRTAWLPVAPELLRRALHLPESTAILAASTIGGLPALLVADDDLPVVPAGAESPVVDVEITHTPERYDVRWEADDER